MQKALISWNNPGIQPLTMLQVCVYHAEMTEQHPLMCGVRLDMAYLYFEPQSKNTFAATFISNRVRSLVISAPQHCQGIRILYRLVICISSVSLLALNGGNRVTEIYQDLPPKTTPFSWDK